MTIDCGLLCTLVWDHMTLLLIIILPNDVWMAIDTVDLGSVMMLEGVGLVQIPC